MDYYPIQLNLKGKQAIIIGGGKVAQRKLAGLLRYWCSNYGSQSRNHR